MSGQVGTTRPQEAWRRRAVYFIAAVALGALGIVWIHSNVRRNMRALEESFAEVKTERFYRGVYLRLELRRVNDLFLDYHLEGKPAQLTRYLQEADALRQWIANLPSLPSEPMEREYYTRLRQAYSDYLRGTAELQKRPGLFGPSRRQVDAFHEQLNLLSGPIDRLCAELINVQREEFQDFLLVSQATLDGFQGSITASTVLLIALSILVVALVFRGMIQPLRRRLSQSEATLHRHEKLAALGTLAAGVAHEIRNPLTAIKFRLFSLGKSLPPGPAGREDLGVIDREIQRLDRIVKDFIQFARPSEPAWVQVPARRVLEELRGLMEPELRSASIRLNLPGTRNDPWLRTDPQQLKQVMINLIQNAVESMPHGGTLTLGLDTRHTALRGDRRPVVVLDVIDTGTGMSPETCARLFDPFFTTKEGGTGLGLSIAARLIDKLGGELRFQTRENHGTTFSILLPQSQPHES